MKVCGFSIHGDGVSISGVGRSWAKSVDVYSWSSMLSNTSTKLSNYLIYIMYWKLVSPNEHFNGFQKFMRLLTWSLYWLMLGRWPSRDAYDRPINSPKAGKQLAGGVYAVLWTLKADLEHMAKIFDFPYPASAQPCGLCKADTASHPWTDCRPCASWRSTVWSQTTWLVEHPNCNRVWLLPGLSIHMFIPDVMHTMHLGTYQYAMGSILQYLVFHKMPDDPETNLHAIWKLVKQYYEVLADCWVSIAAQSFDCVCINQCFPTH